MERERSVPAPPPAPPPEEVLKKFYRAFHKHGAPNWPKIAKECRLTAEQCEALHRQHQSFLSLPAKPDLETAFVAMVTDHYNATQQKLVFDDQEEETRSGRPGRRGAVDSEEEAGHVTATSNQKPRRTPKPTREKLEAEEELMARKQATPSRKAPPATPPSAKARAAGKLPGSPTGPEWASPGRKRSRKLFEDFEGLPAPQPEGRFRSPTADRWRTSRHNNDVDEGVDALLSLASGAHAASTNLDEEEGPNGAPVVTNTADAQEAELPPQMSTPRRGRGRGGRGTPSGTPLGTPSKGLPRMSSTTAVDAAAMMTGAAAAAVAGAGMRSPHKAPRGTPTRAPPRAATPKKEPQPQLESPTTSSQLQPGENGTASGGAGGVDQGDGSEEAAGVPSASEGDGLGGAAGASGGLVANRPQRRRKPSAIAVAAAMSSLQEAEEAMASGRMVKGAAAAAAAAAAVLGAAQATAQVKAEQEEEQQTGAAFDSGNDASVGAGAGSMDGGTGAMSGPDLAQSTAVLLAGVPPVKTHGLRGARGGPAGGRRGGGGSPTEVSRDTSGGLPLPASHALIAGKGLDPRGRGGAGRGQLPPAGRGQGRGQQGGAPQPRARRRKPQPERLPVALTPFKMLMARTGMGNLPGVPPGMVGAFPTAAAVGAMPSILGPTGVPGIPGGSAALDPATIAAAVAAAGNAGLAGAGHNASGAAVAQGVPNQDGTQGSAMEGAARLEGDGSMAAAAVAALDPVAAAVAAAGLAPPALVAPLPLPPRPVPVGEDGEPLPAAEVVLRHCLGSPRVRRWCMYEFHYSALDRPWFLRNELLEFCTHMQLPTTKLTRLEWSVLRSALGRPRRLSLAFLREERMRLEGYRDHVRLKYDEVGVGMEVPPELPRPLRVGQAVTARHPATRQLHDGQVLTVKGSKYRVQFSRNELMTEVILDTEVMPREPHDCLPAHMTVVPALLNGRCQDAMARLGPRAVAAAAASRPFGVMPLTGSWVTGLDAQLMRESDAATVSEVQHYLEAKEDLVARITRLNDEAAAGMHNDANGNRTEQFQLQYTNVVLQLKETNAALEAALARLTSRQGQLLAAGSNASGVGALLAMQQQAAAVRGGVPGVGLPGGVAGAAGGGEGLGAAAGAGAGAMPALPALPPVPVPQGKGPGGAAAAAAAAVAAAGKGAGKAPGQQAHAQQLLPLPLPLPMPLPGQLPMLVPPPRAEPQPVGSGSGDVGVLDGTGGVGAPAATAQELVEQALAEAKTVVDDCRGKPAGGQQQQPEANVGGEPAPSSDTQRAKADALAAGLAVDGPQGSLSSIDVKPELEQGPDAVQAIGSSANAVQPPSAAAREPEGQQQQQQQQQQPERKEGREEAAREDQSEVWLRDLVVGCVGVLFTVQRCTAGGVAPSTVGQALDLVLDALQPRATANEGLYRDIVQSVQGLKGHLAKVP